MVQASSIKRGRPIGLLGLPGFLFPSFCAMRTLYYGMFQMLISSEQVLNSLCIFASAEALIRIRESANLVDDWGLRTMTCVTVITLS